MEIDFEKLKWDVIRAEFLLAEAGKKSRGRKDLTVKTLQEMKDILEVVDELREWHPITVRQVFYRLVSAKGWENHSRNYKRTSKHLTILRYAGWVSWYAIVDKNRKMEVEWTGDGNLLDRLRKMKDSVDWAVQRSFEGYRRCLTQQQDTHVIVLLEKDALSSIFERVCRRFCVQLAVSKGYSSSSLAYILQRKVLPHLEAGRKVIFVAFSDLDPSGVDIARDYEASLKAVLPAKWHDMVEVHRWALTAEQAAKYDAQETPEGFKEKDSRAARYMYSVEEFERVHGRKPTELDALHPRDLEEVIAEGIKAHIDQDLFEKQKLISKAEKIYAEHIRADLKQALEAFYKEIERVRRRHERAIEAIEQIVYAADNPLSPEEVLKRALALVS